MCAKLSLQHLADESSVWGNTERSRYRVLREVSRGTLRSVNRDHAGRNALSVKGLSLDNNLMWWPSYYTDAKATLDVSTFNTTGVRDLGMHEELLQKLGRSVEGQPYRAVTSRQGVMSKSEGTPSTEVRLPRSSGEVE
jgi:hypothetical protein